MEKQQCPCCGCLTLSERKGWEICPVCYWEDDGGIYKNGHPDIMMQSVANGCISIFQARKNLRQFGACSKEMAKNARAPQPDEITVMYTNLMNDPDGWLDDLARELGIGAFFLVLLSSKNFCQAQVYTEKDGTAVTYTDWFYGADSVHDRFIKQFNEYKKQPGIHLWRFEYGIPVKQRFFSEKEYNSVLYDDMSVYAMFWKEYELAPPGENGRDKLEIVLKNAEKMRSSLVYACYLGDTAEIIERAKTARPTQLNKIVPYMNNPLGFCAVNNDLKGFVAVVRAGAALDKRVAAMTPLNWAMIYSPDIVQYIFMYHRSYFVAELNKQGAKLFSQATDERIFALAEKTGADLSPLAFEFARTNNTAGLRHIIKSGADIVNMTDSYGYTPYFYAERGGDSTQEVRQILLEAANTGKE